MVEDPPSRDRRRARRWPLPAGVCGSCEASPTSGVSWRIAAAARSGSLWVAHLVAEVIDPPPLVPAATRPFRGALVLATMGKASRRRRLRGDNLHESRTRDLSVAPVPFVSRPFEGLIGETDWVAIREVIPAATATVTFADGAVPTGGPQSATVATVLPLGW